MLRRAAQRMRSNAAGVPSLFKAVAIIRSGLTAGPLYDSDDAVVKAEWEEAIDILASPEGGGGGGGGGGASDSETEF